MADGKPEGRLERVFESALWSSRFCVLLAVVFGVISAAVLFIIGTWDIIQALKQIWVNKLDGSELFVGAIIGSVDIYLIGVVLLIFSFGIYELFISKIDVGRMNKEVKILEIANLDELKDRIIKVVIIVLIVGFFKKTLTMEFATPLEMLFFALSIFAICLGVYFMHKGKT